MKRLSENSVIIPKNKSHSVTAKIEMPEGTRAEGTIIAQGGKLKYCYNYMALQKF